VPGPDLMIPDGIRQFWYQPVAQEQSKARHRSEVW